ncbi:hypothetical protein [Actibacterium pelagium]|uniref:hypothetical protein n=1 Tax=Actibacterium pelagium TaxID=2029103 RepID=UPI00117748F1|nr:hypothetical protein [Actibacterium pelagium]
MSTLNFRQIPPQTLAAQAAPDRPYGQALHATCGPARPVSLGEGKKQHVEDVWLKSSCYVIIEMDFKQLGEVVFALSFGTVSVLAGGILWSAFFGGAANASIINQRAIFDGVIPCEAYTKFLAGEDIETTEDCHPYALLVLDLKDMGDREFLKGIYREMNHSSSVFFVSRALRMYDHELFSLVFSWSEVANQAINYEMGKAHDEERLAFYSRLLSDLQISAVVNMCAEGTDCTGLNLMAPFSEIL